MDRPALPKEDLFESSTMTFGEHLEELRRALARAIIWLVAGGLIALVFFAKPVVRWIQGPLEQAIIEFNADKGMAEFELDHDTGSETDKQRAEALSNFLKENGLTWQRVWTYSEVASRDAQAADQWLDAGSFVNQPQSDKPEADAAQEIPAGAKPADSKATEPPETASPAESPAKSPAESPDDNATQTDDATAVAAEPEANQLAEISSIPAPSDFSPQWLLVPVDKGLNSHKVEEPFMIYLKASVLLGAVIASPMIFYHLWGFIAAGLYPHERRYVHLYLPFSVTLFIAGVSLAFFAVLGFVLDFLLDFNKGLSIDIEPRLSYYMNFVLLLPLGFGIAFQLPLVMLFLQRIGLIETSAYESSWRIAVLVIAVLSMVLTPADPYSMILLMCPLVFLYFLGILLCRFMPRGRGLGSGAYDPA